MIIDNRENYIKRVSEYIGDRNDDADISFLEDMTDTYDNYSTSTEEASRLRSENDDLRRKYRERFTSGSLAPDKPDGYTHDTLEDQSDEVETRTYEALFK